MTILFLYLRLRSLRKVSLVIDMHMCLYYLWSDDQWSLYMFMGLMSLTLFPFSPSLPSSHSPPPPPFIILIFSFISYSSLSPPPLFLSLLYPLGTDLTLVGYGAQIQVLRQALKEAENQLGVSCELIDLRTILPWDVDTVVKVTVNNSVIISLYRLAGL